MNKNNGRVMRVPTITNSLLKSKAENLFFYNLDFKNLI